MRNTKWLLFVLLLLMVPGLSAITSCGDQYHTLVVSKGGNTFEFEVPYSFRDTDQTLRKDSSDPVNGIVLERVESAATPDTGSGLVLPTRLKIFWHRFTDLEAGVERIDAETLVQVYLDAWAILPESHEFTLAEHGKTAVAGREGESLVYSAKFMRTVGVLDDRATYVRDVFLDDGDQIWDIQMTSAPEFAAPTEEVFDRLVASFKIID